MSTFLQVARDLAKELGISEENVSDRLQDYISRGLQLGEAANAVTKDIKGDKHDTSLNRYTPTKGHEVMRPNLRGVDAREYSERAGGFLKWDQVNEGDKFKVVTPGHFEEVDEGREYLVIQVDVNGEAKNVGLSPSNAGELIRGFGTSDTEKWVGQFIKVHMIQTHTTKHTQHMCVWFVFAKM